MKKNYKLKLGFDRTLAHSLWRQVIILLVVLILLFGLSWLFLSCSGIDDNFYKKNNISPWLLPLYLLIDTNALNNIYIDKENILKDNAWMLTASTITYVLGGIVFNDMIISVMTTTISRRIHEHQDGKIHYLKSGHHVILGYDDMVPSINP